MQRKSKVNKDNVVKLIADIQQKLSMMSSVLGRIGKDDKQVHFLQVSHCMLFLKLLSLLVAKTTGISYGHSSSDEFFLVLKAS